MEEKHVSFYDSIRNKKTVRSEEEKKKLSSRLNKLEGQLRGIRGMIERDTYCTSVLIQVSAVRAGIDSLSRELMGDHIRGCVAEDLRAGSEESLEELIWMLHRLK